MKRTLLTAALAGLLGGFSLPSPRAMAQTSTEPDTCEAAAPLSPTRLLRRLSLDLRGHAPSLGELREARTAGRVDESTLDAWLGSEAMVRNLRPYHEELLWPYLTHIEMVPGTHLLYPFVGSSGSTIYVSPLRSAFFRVTGGTNLFQPCMDAPARFDANGALVLEPLVVGTATVAWLDGWVEVQPYWAPDTTIKVCAMEAVESEQAPVCPVIPDRVGLLEPTCQNLEANSQQIGIGTFRGTPVDCGGPLAVWAPECGCGSDLRRCLTVAGETQLEGAFNEQSLRIVDRVLREGRPYFEILTDPNIEVNGPIAHYMRNMSRLQLELFADPDPTAPMAGTGLAWTRTEWVDVARSGRHSGVLTSPAYLMRHAAWRQRAHRFYNAFECSAFEPTGPLPSPYADCSQHEDLTQRCGCADCHQTLEPMAAHWGRFAEYGFMSLSEDAYPTIGGPCTPPYLSIEQIFMCTRLYETDPVGEEIPFRGYLNAYVHRSANEQMSITEGPRRLVQSSLESGRLAACTVKRMWGKLMRRDPTAEELREVLPELEATFTGANYDLRALAKAIVTRPAYGRDR